MGENRFPPLGTLKEHRLILWVLLLGFLTGCIYLQIIPPWQHYDEPTQFEYAWLIANRSGLPKRGEYDQSMRREVAASMIENRFFRDLDFTPNLIGEDPIWIGISQIGELPLYYWIAALPLRIIRFTDVTFQLRIVRFVSFLFFLVTIVAAYGIACELTKKNHPLRWLLPASIAVLPSFVDIMTSVNDDVGAVVFFSIFLWIGIRLIIQGFSWLRLLLLILFAIFSFWTKNTVVIAVLLVFIPVMFSIFRGNKQKFAWMAFATGVIASILVSISWGDARFWYRSSPPTKTTQASVPSSPLGTNSIRLTVQPGEAVPKLTQLVPHSKKRELMNELVTIGSWIWADKPAQVRTPIIQNEDQVIYEDIQVNEEPQFFMVTAKLEPKNQLLSISLSPVTNKLDQELTVFYDGIVLTRGNHPQGIVPEFRSITAEGGDWDGVEFTNSIRNPSGEDSWPFIRNWVDNWISKYFPGRPSLILASFIDFPNFRPYYATTSKVLFQSFWARFGWGNITLKGFHPYLIIGTFSVVGVIGAFLYLLRNRTRLNWPLLLFLGLSVFSIWGMALARGVSSYLGAHLIVPVARYAYPAVIPTVLLIDVGWLELGRVANDKLKIPQKLFYVFVLLFFIALNILSIYSIIQFFRA